MAQYFIMVHRATAGVGYLDWWDADICNDVWSKSGHISCDLTDTRWSPWALRWSQRVSVILIFRLDLRHAIILHVPFSAVSSQKLFKFYFSKFVLTFLRVLLLCTYTFFYWLILKPPVVVWGLKHVVFYVFLFYSKHIYCLTFSVILHKQIILGYFYCTQEICSWLVFCNGISGPPQKAKCSDFACFNLACFCLYRRLGTPSRPSVICIFPY